MNTHTRKHWFFFALAVALLLASSATMAQTSASSGGDRIAVPLSDPARPPMVRVSLLNGGITIKGGDVKEVIVEARPRHDDDSEKPRGNMKRLHVGSTGLTVEEENNQVRVSADSNNRAIDLTLTVPRLSSLRLRATNDGDINVTGVEGELDVNNLNGEVTLTNVSGSVIAHALNGEIKVTMVRVAPKPMAFSSLNGDIDVTFPADLKANISLKTDNGEVYSDFDVVLQAGAPQQIVEDSRGKGGKYRVKVDKTVRGTINGGGPEIQFTNFNGSIYIRKVGAPR
jgi:DUF4097 and DUF4098 domain-containing protein YvlB